MRFNDFNSQEVGFVVVQDITEATHWLAYEDNKSIIKDSITAGKRYKLEYLKDGFGWDYFVKDDNEQWGMAYMVHSGDYIKVI